MKVQVTYELTDDEMIAIGLDINGMLKPCTRVGAKVWFNENRHPLLVEKAVKIGAIREELTKDILIFERTDGE